MHLKFARSGQRCQKTFDKNPCSPADGRFFCVDEDSKPDHKSESNASIHIVDVVQPPQINDKSTLKSVSKEAVSK